MANIDTRPLPGARKKQESNSSHVPFYTVLGIFIFIGMGYLSRSKYGVLWGMLIALLIFPLAGYFTVKFAHRQQKAIKAFVKANGLIPLSDEQMTELVPPTIRLRSDASLPELIDVSRFQNGYLMKLGGKSVYLFDYRYVNRTKTSFAGVAVIKTKKSYPHIYLDSYLESSAMAVSLPPKSLDKLSLEGDFNDHFTLYSEEGMHIETLSFLTPDVMQTFIQSSNLFDIETYGHNIAIVVTGGTHFMKPNMDALLVSLEAILKEVD